MPVDSHISLIDLTKQLPFNIDTELKEKICFGETLLISCTHYDGDEGDQDQECSDWSSTESEVSEHSKEVEEAVHDKTEHEEEETKIDEDEGDDNFQFYFFPDCTKPKQPKDSKASILTENGMPVLNPINPSDLICRCNADKTGECVCFIKVPCKCGAKSKRDCTCGTLKEVCICDKEPKPVCTCKGSDVCLCHPGGLKAVCSCDKIEKPCICDKTKFPYGVCSCKKKPTLPPFKDYLTDTKDIDESFTSMNTEFIGESGENPCLCQTSIKGECLCPEVTEYSSEGKASECACEKCKCADVKKDEKKEGKKTICTRCQGKIKDICKCKAEEDDFCVCFPNKVQECKCGDPENCKCFFICECVNPCVCDLTPKVEQECTCPDRLLADVDVCTCVRKGNEDLKLKKVREGKSGFRWCHDVDPKHNYFDYAYGRNDKVEHKHEVIEKFKILGLYEEAETQEDCPIHKKIEPPPFVKKVRKPSLDCCSTVGGISFSVETLGEDKDKFLVQVVSHSSKEGAKTGFKLVSIVDMNLHTMEENRTEFIKKNGKIKERRSYVAICDNGYYNKVTRIYDERSVVKRIYHGFQDANDFLLEGANVVLMRYFGITHFRGTVKTDSLLMNGKICQSIYVCYGITQAVVNGKPMYVVKAERHIIEPSGLLHQTLTVLSLRGYIISHEWADSAYMFHINPLLNINPEKDIIEPHEPLRKSWREDLQLLSDYLDFKSARLSENARYIAESGGLTSTVRDYLQALLLLKPQDALHFTKHYFESALSAMDLPHNEYFDPTVKHVRYFYFED